MNSDANADDAGLDVLGRWLAARWGADHVDVHLVGRPSGGFSAVTLVCDTEITGGPNSGERRIVLRKETPEPAVYPQQSRDAMVEIDIQQRIMTAIGVHTDLPVAEIIGYESDTSVLGTQFFVMSYVDGVVPIESPPYTTEGFFLDASPQQRTALVSSGLEALARLHSHSFDTLGLDWLSTGRPSSRHLVDLWRSFGLSELAGRSHPELERAWTWIDANLPPDERLVLCWGDPRPGNIIWSDYRPVCLTDFEAACVGPPDFDLAWWLMFDRTMHEGVGASRAEGDPSRDEQRRLYFEFAGVEPRDTTAHEVFAAARYSVIVVRVMNRLDQRGLLPADSMVWRDNPASACLSQLLSELD